MNGRGIVAEQIRLWYRNDRDAGRYRRRYPVVLVNLRNRNLDRISTDNQGSHVAAMQSVAIGIDRDRFPAGARIGRIRNSQNDSRMVHCLTREIALLRRNKGGGCKPASCLLIESHLRQHWTGCVKIEARYARVKKGERSAAVKIEMRAGQIGIGKIAGEDNQ